MEEHPGDATSSADRAAIRAVAEAYASGVDARDAAGVAALFAPDGILATPVPSAPGGKHETLGRRQIEERLATLVRFPATVHAIANHTAHLSGDGATAVTSCFAHHLEAAGGGWTDRVMAIRYHDILRCVDGHWLLVRRELELLWTEHRPVER